MLLLRLGRLRRRTAVLQRARKLRRPLPPRASPIQKLKAGKHLPTKMPHHRQGQKLVMYQLQLQRGRLPWRQRSRCPPRAVTHQRQRHRLQRSKPRRLRRLLQKSRRRQLKNQFLMHRPRLRRMAKHR